MGKSTLFWSLQKIIEHTLRPATHGAPGQESSESRSRALDEHPDHISRRDMVLTTARWSSAAVLGHASMMSGCTLSPALFRESIEGTKTFSSASTSKVALIGGGLCGLSLAYKLAQNGVHTQVYEGSHRLGGRVATLRGFNSQGMSVERGAALIDKDDHELRALCAELRVPLKPVASEKTLLRPERYLVDGIVYTEKQVSSALRPLVSLIAKDRVFFRDGDFPFTPSFDHPLAQNPKIKALDRTSIAQYIEKSGIETWAIKLLTAAFRAEFGLDPEYQSAINILICKQSPSDSLSGPLHPSFVASSNQQTVFPLDKDLSETFKIEGGSDTIITTLAAKLAGRVPIYLDHQLIAVRDKRTHVVLTFQIHGQTRELRAEKVVLTLPPSVLASIDFTSVGLSPPVRQAIATWGMGSHAKIFHGFHGRPWQSSQEYFGHGYLAPYGQWWDISLGQAGSKGILGLVTGGRFGKHENSSLTRHTSPNHHPPATLSQISKIYPPLLEHSDGHFDATYWALNPWSLGSATCPKVGQYTTVHGSFNQMQLNGKLFFAGEHASLDYAGSMNGAVNSAQRVADTILKKKRLTRI